MQQAIAELFKAKLLPKMAAIFEEMDMGHLNISIPKLEIDLGAIQLHDEKSLVTALERNLIQQLGIAKQKALATQKTKPMIQSAWSSALFFLEKGYLAWNSPFKKLAPLEEYLVENSKQWREPLLNELFRVIRSEGSFYRLEKQFSSRFFNSIFEWLFNQGILEKELGRSWTDQLGRGIKAFTGASLKAFILDFVETSPDLFFDTKARLVHEEREGDLPKKGPASLGDKLIEESLLYCDYAGIVLIAPFLETFFKANALLKEGRFVNDQARERAAHLLYFLATGREDPPEEEMLLFKYLVGLDFAFPLGRQSNLSRAEKREAEHLLESIIAHWNKLKNTSLDGLRSGFFQREGKLVYDGHSDQYQLRVEQKGIDVLLAYLPWGIATIHWPWLKARIVVEWA